MVKKFLSNSQRLFSHPQSNILSAAAMITGASLLSAVLGLLRNRMLVSFFFGDPVKRAHLDAYLVAFRLPELVFQLLVIGAVSAAFIPIYSSYRKKSEEEANHVAVSMLNLVLLVFALVSAVIFIFAVPFNSLITSTNFSLEQVVLAARLSRIMLLAQLFFAASNFLSGMIQAHRRFLVPALAPLAYNAGIMAGTVFLSPFLGIYGPAIGVVIGAGLHFLLQLPLALKLGFRYSFLTDWKHPGVKEMIRLMPPRTLALSVNQLEIFASVFFATAIPAAGSLTILNLAQQLMAAPIRVLTVPIGQASLPFLSYEAAEGEMSKFKATFVHSLKQIWFFSIPATVLLIILRIPLVRLAYGAGPFPWSATLLTGKAVAVLALSLVAQSLIDIVERAFYALHNTRVPFFVAIISVVVNVVGSILSVFVFDWGILGICAAITAAGIVQFFVLSYFLVHKLGTLPWSELMYSLLRVLLASGLMGVALWGPMRLLDQFVFDTTHTLPLIGLTVTVAVTGGAMYLGMAKLLQIQELNAYVRLVKRVGAWKETLSASEEVLETPSQTQDVDPL